jgi:hypothetical protein
VGGRGRKCKKGSTSRVNEGGLLENYGRNTGLEMTCISPIYTDMN